MSIYPTSFHIPYGPELWEAIREAPHELYNKFNSVMQITELTCRPDWEVVAELALPALGEAALAIIAFDWDDVARGFLRPYGTRSGRSGIIGKINKKIFGKIPEPGELIGKNLPGARIIKGRQIGNIAKWAWRIDGLAQMGLWYWLLVDIGANFLLNWSSGIIRSTRCTNGGAAGYTRDGNTGGWPGNGSWHGFGITPGSQTFFEEWGPHFGNETGFGALAGTNLQVVVEGHSYAGFDKTPAEGGVRLYDPDSGQVIDSIEFGSSKNSNLIVGSCSAGQRLFPQVKSKSGGGLSHYDVHVSAWLTAVPS